MTTPELRDSQAISVTVVSQNLPPVNSVPGNQVVGENVRPWCSRASNGNLISGQRRRRRRGATSKWTLSVSDGTLTLFQTSGLAFSVGDGDTDAVMTFTGSQADINLALDGLIYTPTPAWSGNETLTITTKDHASVLELAPTTNYKFNVDGTRMRSEATTQTLNNGAAIVTDSERGNVLETDGIDDHAAIPAGRNQRAFRVQLQLLGENNRIRRACQLLGGSDPFRNANQFCGLRRFLNYYK